MDEAIIRPRNRDLFTKSRRAPISSGVASFVVSSILINNKCRETAILSNKPRVSRPQRAREREREVPFYPLMLSLVSRESVYSKLLADSRIRETQQVHDPPRGIRAREIPVFSRSEPRRTDHHFCALGPGEAAAGERNELVVSRSGLLGPRSMAANYPCVRVCT